MGKTNQLGVLADVFTSDASNNVGIGGSPSGSYKLEVTGAGRFSGELSTTSGLLSISGAGGGPPTGGVGFRFVSNRLIVYGGSSDITFQKNSNAGANMTILESGNVGIGTSSPSSLLHLGVANAAVDGTKGVKITNPAGTTVMLECGVSSDSFVGTTSGSNFHIRTNNVNRVTLTNGGNIGVGTDSPDAALTVSSATAAAVSNFKNTYNSSGTFCIVTSLGSNANNTSSYHYLAATGGADKCYILGNGNLQNINNSYGQLSDIKLKKEVTKATPKLQDLLKVNIVNFKFINDENETKQIGVIAQELEQIFPSMVDESEDFKEVEIEYEEGNIIKERQSLKTFTKSVKYSVFVPMLIKAMQEQQEIIEDLKSRLDKAGL